MTFLVPRYIYWRKPVDAADLLSSATISTKRAKIIRQALSQADRLRIDYQIENPLSQKSFEKFLDFYAKFNQERGYEIILRPEYWNRHDPANLFLITVTDCAGAYYGGRLVRKYHNLLSTDYRALARTKAVKDGFDTVCEKICFDLAVQTKSEWMGRGRDLNIRGVNNRSVGIVLNKLKYGYVPKIKNDTPREYLRVDFLREEKFSLVLFFSIENTSLDFQPDQNLVLNFICGENPDWGEIDSITEKSMYPVRVWDMDFRLMREFMPAFS